MHYYIVKKEIFDTLNKENIQFMFKSIDKSKNIVVTSDTISSTLNAFNNVEDLSTYTFDNHNEWTGSGSGISVLDINETNYHSEIDD